MTSFGARATAYRASVPDDAEIRAYHAQWNTPPHVVDGFVRRATGGGVEVAERWFEGHGNEVYMVRTAGGHDVVVRICHRPGRAFDRELWPIEAARRVGIPVAEILLVDHGTDDNGDPVSFSVQRRLPGVSMWRCCDDLPVDVVEGLTGQAGELLAQLHAVDAPNDGPIAPDGTPGGPEMQGPEADDNLRKLRLNVAYAAEHGIGAREAETAMELISRFAVVLERPFPPKLIHGDWRITNLLVVDSAISGVVDWEGGGGGDPSKDFPEWDVWSDDGPTRSELLFDGYRAAGGRVDDDLQVRRICRRAASYIGAIAATVSMGRLDEAFLWVDRMRPTLMELLAFD